MLVLVCRFFEVVHIEFFLVFPLMVVTIIAVVVLVVDRPLNKILCLHCGVCDGHKCFVIADGVELSCDSINGR